MKIDKYFHLYGRKNDVVFEEVKWTPVSEALPEEDIDVLLQFPHTMAVGYQENGFWNIVNCDDLYSGLDKADAKPIAWMSLPEPWRGE